MYQTTPYIMRDQYKKNIDSIMQYDLTWRQKRSNKSMHLSIFAGLTIVAFLSQVL